MKIKFLCMALLCSLNAVAQQSDSIRTMVLSEIVVSGVQIQADTLENFYKSNASATTENILSRMPAVSLVRRGAFGQEPVIRGLSGGQVNMTIDGMKIFGACTDKMDPVSIYIEPANVSAIQARTGVQGAEFGSTFGGAINMKLREANVGIGNNYGIATVDLQSVSHATNLFSSFNTGRQRSGYMASAAYRKSGNYRAGGGEEVGFSQYEKINVAASGKWATGKYDTMQADILLDKGWNIGFPALPMDVGSATAGIYAVTFQRFIPWLIFHRAKFKAYHNRIDHKMDDSHRNDVAIRMDMPGQSVTTGFYTELDVHVFHEHQTIVKLEYFKNAAIGEMTMYADDGSPMYMQTAPDATRQDAGLFINQLFRMNDSGKLNVTFRADLVSDKLHTGIGRDQIEVITGTRIETSTRFYSTAGVAYRRKLAANMNIEVQAGHAQRTPTLNERFGFYLFNRMDNFDYLGNPSLKPEQSWTAEATWNYFGKNIELQVTPFVKEISNYVMGSVIDDLSAMTIGAAGVKQYVNISDASLHGFEATMLAAPFKKTQWITTCRYAQAVNNFGDPLPMIPPLKVVSSIRYAGNRFDAQTEFEWSAAQRYVSVAAGELTTASYTVINARFGYEISQHWKINTGIENALDARYREHLDWGGIPRPGRNYYLNASFTF